MTPTIDRPTLQSLISAVVKHTNYRHGEKSLIDPFRRLVVSKNQFGVLYSDSIEVQLSTPLYVSITINEIIQLIFDADGMKMMHTKKPNMHTTEPLYIPAYIPLMFIYGHVYLSHSYLPKFDVNDVISKIEELLQSDDWRYVEDIKPLTYIEYEFNARNHSCIVLHANYRNAGVTATDTIILRCAPLPHSLVCISKKWVYVQKIRLSMVDMITSTSTFCHGIHGMCGRTGACGCHYRLYYKYMCSKHYFMQRFPISLFVASFKDICEDGMSCHVYYIRRRFNFLGSFMKEKGKHNIGRY